jgi:hypothetical protein
MPCYSGNYESHAKETNLHDENEFLKAALCLMLTLHGVPNKFEDAVKDSGIKVEGISVWWKAHKRKDEQRRQREAEEKFQKSRKKAALSKLTKEERSLLGLNKKDEEDD